MGGDVEQPLYRRNHRLGLKEPRGEQRGGGGNQRPPVIAPLFQDPNEIDASRKDVPFTGEYQGLGGRFLDLRYPLLLSSQFRKE